MFTYNFNIKLFAFFLLLTSLSANTQITYNWQNSKEGWVSGGGCTLTEQPDALAMRSFNTTPIMRSGNLQADLGIDASDYNKVEITLKIRQQLQLMPTQDFLCILPILIQHSVITISW